MKLLKSSDLLAGQVADPILSQMVSRLLSRPIAFHPVFVHLNDSFQTAVFLGQAIYWTQVSDESGAGGWFYKSGDEWHRETCIARKGQARAKTDLGKLGVLLMKKEGVPCTTWYKVDFQVLTALLLKLADGTKDTNWIAPYRGTKDTNKNVSFVPPVGQRIQTTINREYSESTTESTAPSGQPSVSLDAKASQGTSNAPEKPPTGKSNGTHSSAAGGPAKNSRFVPPTPAEVKAYLVEKGVPDAIDPEAFIDYYQARGWKVGGRTVMKDWQATVRTWLHRRKDEPAPAPARRMSSGGAVATIRYLQEKLQKLRDQWCHDPNDSPERRAGLQRIKDIKARIAQLEQEMIAP